MPWKRRRGGGVNDDVLGEDEDLYDFEDEELENAFEVDSPDADPKA